MPSIARRLILTAVVASIVVAAPPATARIRTTATIFGAFSSTGAPTIHTRSRSGYCYTGALTTDRRDAWRCFVGNSIYDPCFSSSHARGVVICPDLAVNSGIKIRLTTALPLRYADRGAPSLKHQPWNIELTSGRHCAFASGASNVVHGVRLNYFCGAGNNNGLWGYPDRRVQPWTILIAPFTATALHQRRSIRHAWM